ncbi:MAG: hypothetical protein EOP83_34630 [Verrucomicrobiaceae bacterium]|nr:MAG: hypothetical protein EOP83_34630 [Verrucomicrobiaceae bacterium]
MTEGLSYRVRPFTDNGPPTWQVATVVSIQPRTEARLPADRDVYALSHEIVVTRLTVIRRAHEHDFYSVPMKEFKQHGVEYVYPALFHEPIRWCLNNGTGRFKLSGTYACDSTGLPLEQPRDHMVVFFYLSDPTDAFEFKLRFG